MSSLDKFMAKTMNDKLDVHSKMAILPPWPHEDSVEPVAHENNPFREKYGLNGAPPSPTAHSPLPTPPPPASKASSCTPAITASPCRWRPSSRPRSASKTTPVSPSSSSATASARRKSKPRSASDQLTNMVSLPYQPLSQLRFSLSAADVHLVSVGNESVGTIHPCKIYGAMAVARPIVLLAPNPCHVSDLVSGERGQEDLKRAGAYRPDDSHASSSPHMPPGPIGWHIPHGDVDRAEQVIRGIIEAPQEQLAAMGDRARHVVETQLSKPNLCGAFCDVLERGLKLKHVHREGLEAKPKTTKSEAA